jgi:alkaline phosphatase
LRYLTTSLSTEVKGVLMKILKRLSVRPFCIFAILALLVICAVNFVWVLDKTGRGDPRNIWLGHNPKYVFLFIGDGMGTGQIRATEAYLAALHRTPALARSPRSSLESGLVFTGFPAQGWITTHSYNEKVTDSAAAGTALATGHKNRNGVIGLPPSFIGWSFPTLAEAARRGGRRIGIITSVSINHATPAAFYAHIPGRGRYYEIGRQLIESGFDYFAGGGFHKYDGNGQPNLYGLAEAGGIAVLRGREAILSARFTGKPVFAVNPVLDNSEAIPDAINGPGDGLGLNEFVQKGIELLDNPGGFFMMVEGGKIDWACHENSSAKMLFETMEFNLAVRAAVNFAEKNPDETLIVITADHETGGLSRTAVSQKSGGAPKPFDVTPELGRMDEQFNLDVAGLYWHTNEHTSSLVPVFASGPGSIIFSGSYDNTDVAWKLFSIMGVMPDNTLR